ncbi:MAG: hypothetical protein Q9182_005919 [Xanthomendoza sp. 2 TL-2023]
MVADYSKKKNAELEELLKSRSLPHTGKKAELIARLQQSDKDATAAKPSASKPSTSKTDIPPEDEIDWDDDAIAPEIPTTNTSKTDIPPKSASTPAAAVAIAAGGQGQSTNPAAVPNQIPTNEPFKPSDITVSAPTDPAPKNAKAAAPTTTGKKEDEDEKEAPTNPPTDYTAHIPLTTPSTELAKRRKRAERFAIPSTDAESIKKLERAAKFGSGATDAQNNPAIKGLDEALPDRRKRGRGHGGDDEATAVRGGKRAKGGGRERSRSKGHEVKKSEANGASEAKAAQRKRDLEKAEERKKRFAVGGGP